MDPITLMMFALIALLIFFMFRNGKKRQKAMQELQSNLRPGAEVMLQSGIFAVIEGLDEETNRATVRSGLSTLIVHRNAISQVVTPVDAEESADDAPVAPDDDPAFGERVDDIADEPIVSLDDPETPATENPLSDDGEQNDEQNGDAERP